MTLNCLIVDDEPIARKVITEFIEDIPFLTLKGTASNPLKATCLLNELDIDILFMDIQMPKMNGLHFLKISKKLPLVIITTAFPEYALEGYELDVLDYLVKPIPFDRFLKACNKAKEYYESKLQSNQIQREFCFIKCENKFEKIVFDELLFVEAASNYVYIQTKEKRFITYLTFKSVEESLPENQFIRVHKSFIVSLQHIYSLTSEEIKIGTFTIPISRSMKEEVLDKIVKRKLLRRI